MRVNPVDPPWPETKISCRGASIARVAFGASAPTVAVRERLWLSAASARPRDTMCPRVTPGFRCGVALQS